LRLMTPYPQVWQRYNSPMRSFLAASLLLCTIPVVAQEKPASQTAVTVPALIDHNRIVIDVDLPLPGGTTQKVRAWVDNGDPDFYLSRHLAGLLGLSVTCNEKECSSPAPAQIMIGGMSLPLADIRQAKIPLKPVNAASVIAAGMNVELNLPSVLLRHYDVLIDFPGHKFTIGPPGSIRFRGSSSKVQINPENALIQVPGQIENKKYNLALDMGSSIGFLFDDLFDKLASAHPDWPHMSGAVGSANMWGLDSETKWKVMRIDRVQFGPLFLTDVAMVELPQDWKEFFSKRAGVASVGLLGANALQNYRVGLDYAHSTVYFEIGKLFNFPEFDVVGLVLRPEDDGQYTVLGVAEFDGKPSVPDGPNGVQAGDHLVAAGDVAVRGTTMGQVWAMLGGTPGQERKLTLERNGKQFTVIATVQHFLAVNEDSDAGKKKSRKK
jgi:hypothetical protein